MNDLTDLLYQVFLTIVAWESGRMAFNNFRKFEWEDEKDAMMEECQMCFKKYPNLEYHKPRCSKKPRITYSKTY